MRTDSAVCERITFEKRKARIKMDASILPTSHSSSQKKSKISDESIMATTGILRLEINEDKFSINPSCLYHLYFPWQSLLMILIN